MNSYNGIERDLLDDIYEGILEPSPWETFLARCRELMRADSVALFLRAPSLRDEGLMLSSAVMAQYGDLYRRVYFRDNPFIKNPTSQPTTIDELIPRAKLVRTAFYQRMLKPAGTEYILGTHLSVDRDSSLLFTISRNRGAGDFGELEKTLIASLSPHLARAIRIFIDRHILEVGRSVFAHGLDQLAIGLVIIDQSHKVICANREAVAIARASRILELEPGMCFQCNSHQGKDVRRLLKSVRIAFARQQLDRREALRLRLPEGGKPLHMLASPIETDSIVKDGRAPAIAVFLQESELRPMPAPDTVRSLFGLSRSESRIATLITTGLTVDEVAEQLDIKPNTVRVHLRSIFSKMGVSRQVAMVSQVLRSVALLAG